jgi:hypothetical protein
MSFHVYAAFVLSGQRWDVSRLRFGDVSGKVYTINRHVLGQISDSEMEMILNDCLFYRIRKGHYEAPGL